MTTIEKQTPAQFEATDKDGMMLTCAFGEALSVPPAYACTIALTTPKGNHTEDRSSRSGGNYLIWYDDGGFVISAGLTVRQARDLIAVLQQALETP